MYRYHTISNVLLCDIENLLTLFNTLGLGCNNFRTISLNPLLSAIYNGVLPL